MRTVKKVVLFLAVTSICLSCNEGNSTGSKDTIVTTHYNIHFVPDLSNRVDKKSLKPGSIHDTVIFNEFIDLYVPLIYPHRRRIQQKDILQLTRISSENSVQGPNIVSLKSFEFDQGSRIRYVRDSSQGLINDLSELKLTIARTYESRNSRHTWSGDITSLLQNSITNLNTITDTINSSNDEANFIEVYDNIIVLLTDGYIEYGSYSEEFRNRFYHLDSRVINKIRGLCRESNMNPSQVLEMNDMGLVPVENPLLKHYKFVVLEFDDRSLSKSGSATIRPTDFEITTAVWKKWFEECGIRQYAFYPIGASSAGEIIKQQILAN
ncbi:hypothetical protein [Phaeocystidibacter luteus]|uniref:Uncharacterized protein n=1 Tax=Phaeocystidibacter luteus TaxID=911197 RepID=A0A6N6RHS2_9FLAO|nr:hypothetical protein [Phaeocystidibacter luteus]KAB2810000.1 hypothetical protein F8C67_08965 [Phaeocystidibacter luteus]